MKIETIIYHICPTCGKHHEKMGVAVECCRIERIWRDMWEDVKPGTTIYVEKKNGDSFITNFISKIVTSNHLMVTTVHASDCTVLMYACDLEEKKVVRIATKEDMIQR